ncbi:MULTISPECIES: anthranilate synthase component II [unclassified Avibacterium]|uniref:anthranilate synthase component II n=1 Tax=unclassified Avibacterium TaxID=2685287 RepID=UPI002026FEC4|nr:MULTISPECIES: anthranilate synthase component II [unclassified Avibacterium]MCW9698676.1 anthranilate synthase component II [Avibacterium sp. 20-129]MCW9717664.1 anthranilate synthase component II [Avibacterium sp. 21-599]URL02429.1 anthranilate synthase component II [Avibacterium sp. 20-126]URL07096.1 anthranilate synthase component II [Avibacterium sp. 21-595]
MNTNLLIINNHDSFTYNLVDLIRQFDVPFSVQNVEHLSLDEVENFSHILISPGPDVPRAYPQLFAMLERYQHSKSILGVCLGHQTLCEFFGATLYNLAQVRHGQAKQIKVRSNSGLFLGLPSQFQIGLYHSWAVSKQNFPPELDITATCEEGIIMAMQHRHLPIFGVQFHPESYISAQGKRLIENWLKT